MKGVKWFIACLTLFGLFVPSLSISSDVNALSHDISAIPFYSDEIPYFQGSGVPLKNQYLLLQYNNSSYYQFSQMNINAPWYFGTYFDGSSCAWSRGSIQRSFNVNTSSSFQSIIVGFPSLRGVSSGTLSSYSSIINSQYLCNQTSAFGTITSPTFGSLNSHPNFNTSSFDGWTWINTPNATTFLPYYYSYSHAYISRIHGSDSDGYTYDSSLKMSDIFGVPPSKFSILRIPMGRVDPNYIGTLTSGRSIEFRGIFNFPNVSFNNGFSYSSTFTQGNSKFQLVFTGSHELSTSYFNSTSTTHVDCNFHTVQVLNDITIQYSCPLVLDQSYDIGYAYLYIQGDSTGSLDNYYIFDTSADWSFSGLRVVTDYDETLGRPFNDDPTGNYLEEAPNGDSSIISNEEWYDSLSNLFNFNFVNPFAPLFEMFTNNNSCVNIPTIAEMIHSEETTICPWFDSTTRNIVTPVLGMSSLMLVFGFAVHWLGARSGNLFEDSVDTDNYSFSNKFRRKK